ncbi:hypothetical protein L226DRAFT_67757 [Lentinus tigrinus ALCF2SS1-7]|uniref:uncharacterized protein n=1 Tax=Lentinus tigrinus ALCF2SS1-7 TaxID=1328758 RepID=UPI001165FD12|nr:hypothetical protein L226DRAFT_67757 [Lentinus tigrinus ALCF2SS1-7]
MPLAVNVNVTFSTHRPEVCFASGIPAFFSGPHIGLGSRGLVLWIDLVERHQMACNSPTLHQPHSSRISWWTLFLVGLVSMLSADSVMVRRASRVRVQSPGKAAADPLPCNRRREYRIPNTESSAVATRVDHQCKSSGMMRSSSRLKPDLQYRSFPVLDPEALHAFHCNSPAVAMAEPDRSSHLLPSPPVLLLPRACLVDLCRMRAWCRSPLAVAMLEARGAQR